MKQAGKTVGKRLARDPVNANKCYVKVIVNYVDDAHIKPLYIMGKLNRNQTNKAHPKIDTMTEGDESYEYYDRWHKISRSCTLEKKVFDAVMKKIIQQIIDPLPFYARILLEVPISKFNKDAVTFGSMTTARVDNSKDSVTIRISDEYLTTEGKTISVYAAYPETGEHVLLATMTWQYGSGTIDTHKIGLATLAVLGVGGGVRRYRA